MDSPPAARFPVTMTPRRGTGRRLPAPRPLARGELGDSVVRLIEPTLNGEGYVRLAFDEIWLTAAVHRAHDDEEDARAALVRDAEGIGAGADVTDRPLPPAVVGAVATSGA